MLRLSREISHPPSPLQPWLQLRLDPNLHNLPHLEGMGEGENLRVERTEEGVLQRPEENQREGGGARTAGGKLQITFCPALQGSIWFTCPGTRKKKWAVT